MLVLSNWVIEAFAGEVSLDALESLPVLHLSQSNPNELGQPPRRGRTGGGSRTEGNCLAQPIALSPGEGRIINQGEEENCIDALPAEVGYTSALQPTFWIYVPPSEQSGLTAKLFLIDGYDAVNIQEISLATSTNRIIRVDVPYDLEIGKVYAWEFQLVLNSDNPAENPRANGYIQRREVSSEAQVFWYDKVTATAVQLQQNPSDAITQQQWSQLLESEGLQVLENVGFLD